MMTRSRCKIRKLGRNGSRIQREINKLKINDYQEVAGIARYLSRDWGAFTEPQRIDNIPAGLLKQALRASQKQLQEINDGKDSGYFEPERRKERLEEQIALFSGNACVIS